MAVQFILLTLALLMLELLYFRIATKFRIIDRPNDRSSHSSPTIRGGGIIFLLAVLIWFVDQNFKWPWLVIGVSLVAIISFLDDLNPHPAGLRFLIHLAAGLMMFYQVPLFDWSWWLIFLALIVCIGSLSAFNFMDGINGITGVYALVSLGSFACINYFVIGFTDSTLITVLVLAVVIFLFFNFRKKAICFAGDVGSITIAFVQIFFLLQLIHKTNNFYWVLIFLVYGLDSVVTILYRIKNKENIFKAHRTHLYQYLVNELRLSHLSVSLLYGVVQLVINMVLIFSFTSGSMLAIYGMVLLVIILYLLTRRTVLVRMKLQIDK